MMLLLVLLLATPAWGQACVDLCKDHPEGQVVWEKSDVCTYPRQRIIGNCLPNDSWWPMVRVTCLVDGKPIPELQSPGTTGWIGASLCPPAIVLPPLLPGKPTLLNVAK